jgi:hypothetical protein
VGQFRSRQPVAEFVFEKKRGWCEYFASAAAVLLRLQGVPARYVTGFSMAGAERAGGHYLVRESDAHAWIEAYVPGRGWIEADPTPAAEYASVHAGMTEGRLSRWKDALFAALADLAMAFRLGDLAEIARRAPVALLPLVAGALGMAAWRWARRRPARAGVTAPRPDEVVLDPEVAALAARLERLWARRGCPRPRHRAPLEHLEASGARLDDGSRATSRDVVACLYRARYGGIRPLQREVADLQRRLGAAGA